MSVLKSVWVFLKTHWYIPVIIVVGIIFKSKSDSLLKIIDTQKESYKKQKDAIEAAEIEKKKSKEKINNEFNNAVTAIESFHEVQGKKLEASKKKEIKNIVKKHYNDKQAITSEIKDLFGITYVPKKNNDNSN
jgi:Na+-transporting NADH:ubiquinone oxidoreductase subunit NqrC|tara:strand:+ start:439 stop:837 length:399 start_codon:yes stop_codon:yes gene_type:complete